MMSGIIWLLIGLCVGALVGFIIRMLYAKSRLSSAEKEAARILSNATRDIETRKKEMLMEAKEDIHRARQDFDKDTKERRNEIQQLERRLSNREEEITKKQELVDKKQRDLTNKERTLEARERFLAGEVEKIAEEKERQKRVLERVASMTSEEAKQILMKNMEDEARHDAMGRLKKIEDELQESAQKKSKEIISLAIQRYAADHTADVTISTVSIPSDEMKGRIIGREGRNIKAFEVATGVDVIVDDTPEAITITSFDGIRREIARVSLERLITDGRIHPGRIEEVVARVTKEMDQHIKDIGEQAALETGVVGLPTEILKLLGRLKYRTSYGQNVLQHSLEVAHLARVMANELELDVDLCVRAGLLHDIGKAVDHTVEGTHTQIGGDIMRKYYADSPKLINAVVAHHEGDVKPESPEAVLIAAADAISASRPGARRESLDFYLKRMQKLEEIATTFKGVDKAYAIQAGREIRIIVEPAAVDDSGTIMLAREIAQKIENELEYPGQIKVTVIRETRASELAK